MLAARSRILALRFEKLGELGEFVGRLAQRFGGVRAHCRHNFVVQIGNQLGRFFFQTLHGFGPSTRSRMMALVRSQAVTV